MASIVTIDGLPVYQAVISDEQCGMLRISLVDDPAVQSNFVAFSKNQQPRQLMYAVQNEDKRLVLGVVMRADFPILRRQPLTDDKEMEFYIIYKADTIRAMAASRFARQQGTRLGVHRLTLASSHPVGEGYLAGAPDTLVTTRKARCLIDRMGYLVRCYPVLRG